MRVYGNFDLPPPQAVEPLVEGWSKGDQCYAPFDADNLYYKAVLEDYDEPSDCWKVFFSEYGNRQWYPQIFFFSAFLLLPPGRAKRCK